MKQFIFTLGLLALCQYTQAQTNNVGIGTATPATQNFMEYAQDMSSGGQWLVRTGNLNMPGQGSANCNIIYPKVIEEGSDNGIVYRTIHNYSRGYVIFPLYGTSWPFVPYDDFEDARGNETSTEWQKYNMGSFTTAKANTRVYEPDPYTASNPTQKFTRWLWGIKCSSDSYQNSTSAMGTVPPQFIRSYHINVNSRLYLTSDTTTTYDLNNPNKSITEWHDYTYGDNNLQPTIVRSGNNSDGSVSIQKNYYASDMPDANTNINTSFAAQMVATNRVGQPLGTKQFKDAQLLSQQYTYSHFNGSQLLVDSLRQALFNNPLTTEVKVQSYSPFANPLSILLRGGKYRKYIWNDALGLPLATCVTGQDSRFVFTSFEYPNEIPWTETSRNTSNAFSGKYAYNLTPASAIYMPGLSSTTGMDVYVWSTGNIITANGSVLASTGKTKGNWTLYTIHLGNVASINLTATGSGALIDQLLVLPTGSQFQGNVYDSFNRVTAVVNDQIMTSFYEYDNFGRLSTVKDEKGNILKSTSYQYQGPQ